MLEVVTVIASLTVAIHSCILWIPADISFAQGETLCEFLVQRKIELIGFEAMKCAKRLEMWGGIICA